jgi:DNA polymerase I-like protein with 3'-5' exonuclease and polymerase domains
MEKQPTMFETTRDTTVAKQRERDRKAEVQEPFRQSQLVKLSSEWRPDPPPELRGERRIVLNAETNGLEWYDRDRPIGWSYYLPESGRKGYLPMRHEGGGNLDPQQVHDWLRSLKHIEVDNTNTKFDLHMARADGTDLVEQGCTFGDIAHRAALLDDHRKRFNLDMLSLDHLGWDVTQDGLGKLPPSITSEKDFQFLHAGLVAPYAIRNVEQVQRLHEVLQPQIIEQELERVLTLEAEVIPVVVEMEKNGTYLDVDLLDKWQKEITQKIEDKLYRVEQLTGIEFGSADSSKDMTKLFQIRGIPLPTMLTEGGAPSFAGAVLREIKDEAVQLMCEVGELSDLESKYTGKYSRAVRRSDGWMRFNLHQLRSVGDGEDKKGTVSGRFSAAGDRDAANGRGRGGYNPQQVVAVEKQLERGWNPDYVIRKLFKMNFAADMMQVEYRLFAHYAGLHEAFHLPPKQKEINGKMVWIQGPLADFHALVSELLLPLNPRLNRKLVKNINFAKIYGAGLLKFAFMIGMINERQYQELLSMLAELCLRWGQRNWLLNESPYCEEMKKADEVNEAYNRMFPAVGRLLKRARGTAEDRGYVMDLMGGRARIIDPKKFHSALNRIIQGGAARINKRVLVETYKERKRLGLTMQLTVHDELTGRLADPGMLPEVEKVLNHQYFNLRVPILWDCKTGNNWAECK